MPLAEQGKPISQQLLLCLSMLEKVPHSSALSSKCTLRSILLLWVRRGLGLFRLQTCCRGCGPSDTNEEVANQGPSLNDMRGGWCTSDSAFTWQFIAKKPRHTSGSVRGCEDLLMGGRLWPVSSRLRRGMLPRTHDYWRRVTPVKVCSFAHSSVYHF